MSHLPREQREPALRRFARPVAEGVQRILPNVRLYDYFQILLVGSGVRVFALASQFFVLLILSRVLSKATFGDMMAVFGFYRLASISLGLGGSLVLLFHVSRRPDDKQAEIRLHRYAALLGAFTSSIIAVCGFLGASTIAQMLGKPGMVVWLRELSPFVVFSTLLVISTGALEGRSRVSTAIALGEAAPNVVRIVLLPIVGLLHLPESYVAQVLTLSVIIPWLWPALRLRDRSVQGLKPWTRWDYSYCAKFMIAMLFANQLGGVDILVANSLFPSDAIADYAVASRLAGLFSFLQLAVLKRFAPLAGRLIETGNLSALHQEAELCRRLMVALGALTIAGVLLFAPLLLPAFGNYAGADIILIWLAIPPFVESFYSTADRLLTVGGQATVTLIFNGSSFFVLVTMPFLTAHWIGLICLPVAMIVSTLLFNLIIASRAQTSYAIRTIRLPDAACMAVGTVALASYAMHASVYAGIAACAVLAAIGLFYALSTMKWRVVATRSA